MSNETTDNFFQVWNDWNPQPVPAVPRLYYNDQGEPVCYTFDDRPGSYIEIDSALFFEAPNNIQVKDGKIVRLSLAKARKLVPTATEGTACHVQDVCVVIDRSQEHCVWGLKTNYVD